jgi:WD40 repeat protein
LPDGGLAVAQEKSNGLLSLWEVHHERDRKISNFPLTGFEHYPFGSPEFCNRLSGGCSEYFYCEFSPSGTLVTFSIDNRVWVYETMHGHLLSILDGHTASIDSITFAQDDRTVTTTAGDSTIRIWDIPRA